MAVDKVEKLLKSIKEAFAKRDDKEEELKAVVEKLEKEVSGISKEIDGLSYKALIEEDATTFKEYQALKKEEEKKIAELELAKERVKALDKFELGIDRNAEAKKIYRSVADQVEVKFKEMGKISTSYCNALEEARVHAKAIKELEREVALLPYDLIDVVDWLKPEDVDAGGERLGDFKGELETRRRGSGMYLFDFPKGDYKDKRLSSGDVSDLY